MGLELGDYHRAKFSFRTPFLGRLSRMQLFKLFAICAFPIHIWAILMVLRDITWVAERTNAWDAVGLVAYALVFALLESLVVFIGAFFLTWLAPRQWSGDVLLVRMALFVLIFEIWAMISQLLYTSLPGLPLSTAQSLANFQPSLSIIYVFSGILVAFSLIIPLFLLNRYPRFERSFLDILDRLITLTILYLVLDFAAILVIIARNI